MSNHFPCKYPIETANRSKSGLAFGVPKLQPTTGKKKRSTRHLGYCYEATAREPLREVNIFILVKY